MAYWFHLKPWDVDELTSAELVEFLKRLDGLPRVGAPVADTL